MVRFRAPSTDQQWGNYLFDRTADILNDHHGILCNEHWVILISGFLSDTSETIGHSLKGPNRIFLTTESWNTQMKTNHRCYSNDFSEHLSPPYRRGILTLHNLG